MCQQTDERIICMNIIYAKSLAYRTSNIHPSIHLANHPLFTLRHTHTDLQKLLFLSNSSIRNYESRLVKSASQQE